MQAHLNVIASSFNQDTLLSNGDFDKNSFVVYPNPNKGYFNIQFSEMVNEYTVHIIDQSGRTVFENKYSGNNSLNQEMNLNATAAGVYFITIKSDDFITTKKVLVQ
ncbi:T9SS type A sorting domain-containing protein [Flavobacterium sp.]|uniref:T9SS type A sorting domain-containing protein n=1 Tax=Flavobacterium sp. TaxID=239 RepID=UPI0025BCCD88|nr:T9SS type A sorting domain-containing protein [Flavobacterium sp.]